MLYPPKETFEDRKKFEIASVATPGLTPPTVPQLGTALCGAIVAIVPDPPNLGLMQELRHAPRGKDSLQVAPSCPCLPHLTRASLPEKKLSTQPFNPTLQSWPD